MFKYIGGHLFSYFLSLYHLVHILSNPIHRHILRIRISYIPVSYTHLAHWKYKEASNNGGVSQPMTVTEEEKLSWLRQILEWQRDMSDNSGHYGRLRKAYLEMHRPILFDELVLSDKLFEHYAEIDEAA